MVAGEHIHQVDVSSVVAVQIIIELEIAIGFACLPIASAGDLIFKRSVVDHRQIEAAAVPAHQGRPKFFDPVKKAPQQFRFRRLCIAKRPDTQGLRRPQYRRDGHNLVMRMTEKVSRAGFLNA